MSAINPAAVLFDINGNALNIVSGSISVTGSVAIGDITFPEKVSITGSVGIDSGVSILNFPVTQSIAGNVFVTSTGSLPVDVKVIPSITGSVNVTNSLFSVTGSVGITNQVSVTATGSLPVVVNSIPSITGSVNVTNSVFPITGTVNLDRGNNSLNPLNITGSVGITNQVAVTVTGSLPVIVQSQPNITGSVNVTNSLFNVTGTVGISGITSTKLTDGTNIAAVKAASTAALATDPALVVTVSPNNSVVTTAAADSMSSYSPNEFSYIAGTSNIAVDASGRLETHSTVLTDEGSFRDDFTGTSLNTTLTGGTNITFTASSTTVTGTGTAFTTQIKTGDFIKKSADSETNYTEVASIESDTSLTLMTAYAGTTSTTSGVVSNWKTVTAATSGSISVTSSSLSLGSGTGSGESTYITRSGDYLPYTLNVNLTVSQRIANQTILVGFRDQFSSPNYRCEIQFTGTDNTQVNFVTSGGPNAADTTTLVAILPTSTTAVSHQYKIDLSGNQATLSIDGQVAAISTLHLPPPYALLNIYAGTTNSAIVTATTLSLDAIYWFNTDRLQIDNDFKGEPLPVTIASPVAALAPFVQIGGNSLDAFGDTVSHQYTPIWQAAFISGGGGTNGAFNTTIPNQLGVSYTTGTGAVTSGPFNAATPSMLKLDTGGTAANATAHFRGTKIARYRPGQAMLCRFSVVFASAVARTYQIVGIGDDSDGYFFGYNLTAYGILYRSRGTGTRVDTWIPQSSWNVDKCDGTGLSGFNINPQKGNIYQIKYPFLGFGPIFFQVLNPALNTWITAHVIEYPNANTTIQISDPAMNFYSLCANDQTGGTTAAMYVGSAGIFLSGERLYLGSQFAATTPAQASVTTEASLLGVANAYGINGTTNRSMLRMRTLSVASDGGNGVGTVKLYKGLVPSGASWTAVNGTAQGNPASTAATTVAAGSNNVAMPTGTINVASVAGFPAAGTLLIAGTYGSTIVEYTGLGASSFTGCSSGHGILLTGQAVTLVSSLTSAQSTAFFSTTQTTTLTTTAAQVVWNTVLARNSVVTLDMTTFDMFLAPGEIWWLTGFSSASTTYVAAINWTEDFY